MLVTNGGEREYYESLHWVEVPMWKALKLWANNKNHLKCTVGNSFYFYHGQSDLKILSHDQVINGRWCVEELH